MAPHATSPPTSSGWSVDFDTIKRDKLFRQPPATTAYPALAAAIDPHVKSFNQLFETQIHDALRDIGVKTFVDNADPPNRLEVRLNEVFLSKPVLPSTNKTENRRRDITPAECRERHASYRGRLTGRYSWRVNEEPWNESTRDFGQVPVMLRSNRCHLEHLSPKDLVDKREESEELGGYFIVNGNEKLIRMLIVNRRNYPMAIVRPSFKNRGTTYTEFGVSIRSARLDHTSQTNVLHYLSDGNIIFRFSWRKNEYLVPVALVLKALIETNDREIFESIVGDANDEKQFVMDRVELLLRAGKAYNVTTKSSTREFLGSRFRPVLYAEGMTDEEAGAEFLHRVVLVHLNGASSLDKHNMLIFMIRKLYALVEGNCAPDNPDSAQYQEVLLPGVLYGMLIKERFQEWLLSIGLGLREIRGRLIFTDRDFGSDFTKRVLPKTNDRIGQALEYFLATGNLVSSTGLDLQQTAGFCVVAEKINFYRFISHFRMIHRGSFFAELKTTTVRKLLPESWGFLCPVHTPDGSPCGLLNHLAHKCEVVTQQPDISALPKLIAQFGISQSYAGEDIMPVQLDGWILGYCTPLQARLIADSLRFWKVEGSHGVPLMLDIGYVPTSNAGQYPGLYLSSSVSRMMRPVTYLPLDKTDFVGPFEQPYMSIACTEPEIVSGDSTHVEQTPTNILSIVANQTPFPDFNQSPRNMYQCQMGKQTMGTPGTALKYRTDNKMYRLQTGQTPVVRPPLYNEYGLDNFPNGTNAVVAVISYTGYDMDDAMILNKSAHERGFGFGTIYKTKVIDIREEKRGNTITQQFGFAPKTVPRAAWSEILGPDGLPHVGVKVKEGDIIAAYHTINDTAGGPYVNQDQVTHFARYKETEEAFIDEVKIHGNDSGVAEPFQSVSIRFRIPRAPVIGDKFSSRHGQKGVCSQKWPAVDMPFTESGMQPDVIINPHAFPSRMTIGMFVESMAGKSGALHGLAQDSTPFKFKDQEGQTAVEYFGHQLMRAGFNYHGNEPMYSGITGEELGADIYIGVVYYQRLRHMVNDKFQVRTTGPVTQLTGQPIKGRAKGGGIRVGEMERDSLLAHGTAFLLQDRLMNCSDYTKAWICRDCGSFLSTQPAVNTERRRRAGAFARVHCRRCSRKAKDSDSRSLCWQDQKEQRWFGGANTTLVAIPGVLRYLDVEMAAMGLKMKFKVEP